MYVLRTALWGLFRAAPFTAMSTVSLGLALWLMAALSMALVDAKQCLAAFGRVELLSLELSQGLGQADIEGLLRTVRQTPGVATATLVPAEQSLAAFRARSEAARQLVTGVDASMVPTFVDVTCDASQSEAAALADTVAQLARLPGIASVDDGAAVVARLGWLIRTGTLAAAVLGGALAVATTLMVMATVRLVLVGRQDEVRILRLVGATAWFIRLPFLLEGAFSGALAAALAALGLWGLHGLLAAPLAQVSAQLETGPLVLFSWQATLCQLAFGVLLGTLGSYVAVRPYLGQDVGAQ